MAKSSGTALHEVVSFDEEELILVDHEDRELGHMAKRECHDGGGVLHRAFSLFVFNSAGFLLLQQRAASKRLWPRYWANTCCSHPRRGEGMEQATHRRLRQEMGMAAELHFLFKFEYRATFGELGSEHELCSVFAGQSDQPPNPNPTEIAAWRWVSPAELDQEIERHPERFTPWLKMEWRRLQTDFTHEITRLAG